MDTHTLETTGYIAPNGESPLPDDTMWANRMIPMLDVPKIMLFQAFGEVTWDRVTLSKHVGRFYHLGTDFTVTISENDETIEYDCGSPFPYVNILVEQGGINQQWDTVLPMTFPNDERSFLDYITYCSQESLKQAIKRFQIRDFYFGADNPRYQGEYVTWQEAYEVLEQHPNFAGWLNHRRKSDADRKQNGSSFIGMEELGF